MSPTVKYLNYEWDEDKDIINQLRHNGLAFADAISAFNDALLMSITTRIILLTRIGLSPLGVIVPARFWQYHLPCAETMSTSD